MVQAATTSLESYRRQTRTTVTTKTGTSTRVRSFYENQSFHIDAFNFENPKRINHSVTDRKKKPVKSNQTSGQRHHPEALCLITISYRKTNRADCYCNQ